MSDVSQVTLAQADPVPTAQQLFGEVLKCHSLDISATSRPVATTRCAEIAVAPLTRIAIVALSRLLADLSPDIDKIISGTTEHVC